ncbi:SH3-domain-containing protein [Hypoxylon trugodes]|uniref:SH3-domain-containing protein n=1 Tax=Hypoxylon trugodes TaxID=326681 RepID=UPI002197F7EB|nr:SH3-domain-containing protein [Hypoxylon trugodes]KAI1392255.1 SH3-domain-containing protein [Hypoxylon trugodes]
MVTLERQEIIATNKSLRLIKNELEHLLEKGVLTDNVFDSIHRMLPAETSLSGAPTPATRTSAIASPPPPQSPPVNSMANLAINQNPAPNPAPPAYSTTGPPSLPARTGPPPPPPTKPIIAHARALYKYQAADDRDLSFERDDKIAVYEYMNDDWWMGRNKRTNAEGIFPKNYVEIDNSEKAGFYALAQPVYATPGPAPGGNGGYPPPPPQTQNPYNAHVPPMAVAQEGSGQSGQSAAPSKFEEGGKKFGKKLGNAAIFGAGATLGGKIVNGIF